jgi:hypothetical protein
LGVESDNIKVIGNGQIVHAGQEEPEEFTLEGPISHFKVSFLVDSENSD